MFTVLISTRDSFDVSLLVVKDMDLTTGALATRIPKTSMSIRDHLMHCADIARFALLLSYYSF